MYSIIDVLVLPDLKTSSRLSPLENFLIYATSHLHRVSPVDTYDCLIFLKIFEKYELVNF